MGQSKEDSRREAWTNTGVGLVINLSASFIIYPILGMGQVMDIHKYLAATAMFTGLSYVRNYIVRRWFCAKRTREAEHPNAH